MKQTIIAVGAAAALGFAGAAHAISYFGAASGDHPTLPEKADLSVADPGATTKIEPATRLKQAAGGVGHMLFMPYYNVQNGTETMFNITNTDPVNGKAVKVRLRGASNSDDVMDFTLLLSPNDMWAAMLTYRGGVPKISVGDASCTMPYPGKINGRELQYGRLAGIVNADEKPVPDPTKSILVSEGYIEVLNMADIPPVSQLYKDILHSGGKPGNCTSDAIIKLWSDLTPVDEAGAKAAGLYPNTGGLMGSWMILNQNNVATYSGNMTAIRAESDDGQNGYANIVFSPQNDKAISYAQIGTAAPLWTDFPTLAADGVGALTADPLMAYGAIDPATVPAGFPRLKAAWFDLPDMSTPLLTTLATPQDQVVALDLAHGSIYNEWFSAAEDMEVPMAADWVISQPTRRYYAALDYAKKDLVWNLTMGTLQAAAPGAAGGVANAVTAGDAVDAPASDNPYSGLKYVKEPYEGMGPFACLPNFKFTAYDREEGGKESVAGEPPLSPIEALPDRVFCGEVFVMSFSENSVMNAVVARTSLGAENLPDGKTEGWGQLAFKDTRLPVVGFAATQFKNKDTGKHYGETWPHRWDH